MLVYICYIVVVIRPTALCDVSVVVNRLYQTAAVTKRLPKPDEVVVSMDGSPLVNSDKPNNAVLMPVNDSQVSCIFFFLYKCCMISSMTLQTKNCSVI